MSAPHVLELAPRLAPWPRDVRWSLKAWLFTVAWFELLWLDICGLIGFPFLRAQVGKTRTSSKPRTYDALGLVRFAVRDACVFYFKHVPCLQRSAAVTRMLRRRGLPAQLTIGYMPMPISSHAWVELDGNIVWDRTNLQQFFLVIERI